MPRFTEGGDEVRFRLFDLLRHFRRRLGQDGGRDAELVNGSRSVRVLKCISAGDQIVWR